jgi:5-methylcytosine-specific restriction endonuclease McrA
MPYREYLRTPEWTARRIGKIVDADGRCQVCNSPKDLEVHHRTYERRGAEKWNDLTVLCAECHGLFSAHGKMVKDAGGK